jgi:O-antigen ligase
MPAHIKALIVLFTLAAAVFMVVRQPAAVAGTAQFDFARRRNLWFAITAVAFLAHNFWVYIVLTAVIVLLALPKEQNKLAMYFLLLFAVPPMADDITGLGVINYFFAIDYVRLLSLAVLLPAFLVLRQSPDTERIGRLLPDKLLIGYLVLQFALMLTVSTITNSLRIGVFYAFIDVFLPYYVASRALKNLGQFRDALMAFAVATLLLAAIGMFEFAWHWLLYSQVDNALGINWAYGRYLPRGTTIRATASTGHSIVLGFVMTVAIGVFLYLRKPLANPLIWRCGMLVLCGGLVAALSRGPWLGAVAMVFIFILTGPSPVKSLIWVGMLGIVAVPALLLSPFGRELIEYLPFAGKIDAASVSYRQRLFEISVQLIMEHPVFGAYDFFYSPAMQELKQGGEGFIDLVNTYAGIGLSSGLSGLSLYVGYFLAVVTGIYKAMRRLSDRDGELFLLGRALFATVLSIMVIIFTASSITFIPTVYWGITGIGVAYARMLALQGASAKEAPSVQAAALPSSALRPAFSKSR